MERLKNKQTASGLNGNGLRTWGLLLIILGIVGRCILQRQLLGVGTLTTEQLLESMQASDDVMIYATLALICQALETCAVPIFAFMLAEGFEHTSNCGQYLLRVVGVAVLSEIPYNLAMSGTWLDASSRNPVFGLVFALIMLYFCRMFGEKSLKNTLIKAVVLIAGILWAMMLKIEFGICLILITFVFWAFRSKGVYQNIAGATAAVVCSLTSPLFLAAPMGVLAVHFYNGEKGADNRVVNYLSYPVALLVIGLLGTYGL